MWMKGRTEQRDKLQEREPDTVKLCRRHHAESGRGGAGAHGGKEVELVFFFKRKKKRNIRGGIQGELGFSAGNITQTYYSLLSSLPRSVSPDAFGATHLPRWKLVHLSPADRRLNEEEDVRSSRAS